MMTVLITGNDRNLFSVYRTIASKYPHHAVHLLLEHELNLDGIEEEYFDNKWDQIPTIYAKAKAIDTLQRKVILSNEGELKYNIFVIVPQKISSVPIPENTSNIVLYQERNNEKYQQNIREIRHLLIIGDIPPKLHHSLKDYPNIRIIQCQADNVINLHCFDNRITSATLFEKQVYPVDYVFVTSTKCVLPDIVHQTGLDEEQLHLIGIYPLKSAEDKKIELLLNCLKPEEKYLCLTKLKPVHECDLLEHKPTENYCHSVHFCKIQNFNSPSLNTYFTRKMEQALVRSFDSDQSAYDYEEYYFGSPLLCPHENKTEIKMIRWLCAFRDSLNWRKPANMSFLDCPQELSSFGSQGYIPDKNSIKDCLKWLILKNHEILQTGNQEKNLKQRVIENAWNKINTNTSLIIYFGTQTLYHSQIQKLYRQSKCKHEMVSMGCAGLEFSLRYGLPHISGYLEQEYIFSLPQVAGVILDKGCRIPGSLKYLLDRKVPIIDTERSNPMLNEKDWITFFEQAQKEIENNDFSLYAAASDKYLLDTCSEQDYDFFSSWIVLPACCCQWTEADISNIVKQHAQKHMGVYATGCALSLLMRSKYYPELMPSDKKRQFFGNGSYCRIIDIAAQSRLFNKTVLLEGPAKVEAWMDALVLKYSYGFDIAASNEIIADNFRLIESYLM